MQTHKEELVEAVVGLICALALLYTLFAVFDSLEDKANTFEENQKHAIMSLISKELDIPQKEIVLKRDENQPEFYTATTSKGVYEFKIEDKNDFLDEKPDPIIANMAPVKIRTTEK